MATDTETAAVESSAWPLRVEHAHELGPVSLRAGDLFFVESTAAGGLQRRALQRQRQALVAQPPSLTRPERYRQGGYIRRLPLDPWGNPYRYAYPGRQGAFDVFSLGADGKTIDLKLPAGVEDGTQMRLAGKGEAGPGGNGDAIVVIHLQPHAFFRRDGDNLRLDLPITLDEAVNGAKVKVPTPDGAVMLTVAPGTSSGKALRLKGKGFSRKDGTRGDQLVTIEVQLPEADEDLVRRLDGWRDSRNLRSRLGV